MSKKIFRKVALERLSSPEQLDQMMKVLTPKAWLFAISLIFLLIAIFLWGILGTISLKVDGLGILIKPGGIHNITARKVGRIRQLYVEVGDIVEEGQVVASIVSQVQIENNQQTEKSESFPGRLSSELTTDLNVIRQVTTDIISPFTGRIIETQVLSGNIVGKETVVMSIEALEQNLEAVVYVASDEGKKIHVSSQAQITPSTIRREQYGFIEGKVRSTSEFPVTKSSMMRLLKNESLVTMFNVGSPPIEIIINLTPDTNTISGYKWSSRKGPAQKIRSGTICQVQIVYETQRPIVLLFLWLRELLEDSKNPSEESK